MNAVKDFLVNRFIDYFPKRICWIHFLPESTWMNHPEAIYSTQQFTFKISTQTQTLPNFLFISVNKTRKTLLHPGYKELLMEI